ncbi:beta strand repeat-containing protein [Rosistilla oblonga]|uniref:beta strand repeat-containing protein n=1 Tax=Rosistilla oblonga TaxID=2527990 RepID=UPI003A984B21
MRLLLVLQRLSQANAWARQLLRARRPLTARPPLPVRLRRAAPLTVGRLEKRIVLDASGVLSAMGELVITSDAAAANETVTIDTNTDGELQITELGSPLEIVDELGAPVTSLAGVTSIDVSLGEGQDLLVVDFSNAPLASAIPNISYHGGAASDPSGAPTDRLSVVGGGTQSAIYALDTLLPADGSLQVGDPSLATTTIAFDGLQPIEITGMASTLLQSNDASGGSSTIEISGEFDLVGGGTDADLNVHDGAVLSGTGTVQAGDLTANVNLQSGSTLSPGNSPGILAVADLNFADNTTFDVEIDDHDSADPLTTPTGGVAGIDYDQMQVQGSVTVGTGVVLDLEDLGSTEANPRDVYTIIDNDGSDAIVGRFVDTSNVVLENGDTVTAAGGLQYRIDYNGGDGNDVVLTGIPASRSEVFVSNSFTQTPGTLIADVDFNTAGDQAGLYGIDAFGTIAEAIANVDSGGTVYVDAGTFAHSGTLLIDRSVTIEGQGMNQTELRKAGAPVGIDDEAIRITADNVTLRGMQLGWVDFLANDGQGNVVVTHADQTTIDRVQFGETLGGDPSNDEGYRSAIVFENADDLVVSDSNFAGRWASAAIRDGSGGSGERLLITGNQFSEDHLHGGGPISIGNSPGAPGATFSGTIAFNYFANGIDPTDTPIAGDQYSTVAIADRVVGVDGVTISHNTFYWHDASLPAESVGVSIDPALPGADRISIQDNIFDGFASGDAAAVQSSGVITPVDAVVTNNVFFGNDIDSNQPLDASNRTGADADPFFGGEQVGFAGSTLADFFALRYGSSAAYQSTQFQADIATATPHIGANQSDPIPVGTEDILIAGTDQNDFLLVTFDGGGSGTFVLTTGIGTAIETTLGPVVFSDITSLTFNSYGGDDVLKIVQPDGGSIDVSGGIFFNAGSQTLDGDALILESGPAQTTIDSVQYFFADEGLAGHVGSIAITDASHNGGLGGTTTIHYDGLEPIYDSLNVDDRSFTFNSTAANETITLSSPGDSADPMLPPLDNKIGSENGGVPLSEVVHFNNPNVSMTINGGDGDQTINIDSLAADYRAALTINGDDGAADVVNFNSSLGALLLGSGSVTGTLTVTAETIVIHDGVSFDTSGGDIDGDVTFDAIAGITMHDTSTLAAGTADVRMSAQGDIAISRIVSAETAAITTTDGRIVDNRSSDEAANITATSTALRAATGIGSGTAADDADLDLDVSNLAAVTNAGDIHLQNAKELTVTTVDGWSGIAIVDPLDNNALGNITIRTAGAFQIAAGNEIVNSDGGDITLAAEGNTVGSDLSIAAAVTASGGSGNIHLLAGDSIAVATAAVTATQAGAILLSSGTDFNNGSPQVGSVAGQLALTNAARVQSDAGHISLLSANSIGLGSDVQVQTSGSGTIDLYSTGGAIAMDTTAILQSTDGDIRVSAHGDFTIGDIVASAATVSLTSATGSILDADANDSDLDVVAQRLRFDAAVGFGELGASSNAIETSVDVVSGRSASGGIHLVESDGVTVGDVDATVYRVSATTVPTEIVDGSQSDLVTIGGNGSIVLRSLAGDITLTDGTATVDGNAVVADGSGNVLIAAEGIDADIVADADVRSTTGNLSLIAARDLQLGTNVDIQTAGNGTIDVEASSGSLTMDATATLQSIAGDIRGVANNDLTIGDIFATDANVSLTARTGSILDADPNDADIDVTAQGLRLNAGEGIGTLGVGSNAIETSVDVVTARAAAGGINLLESNGITVGDVATSVNRVTSDASVVEVIDGAQSDLVTTSDDGSIVLRSLAGDITLTDGTAAADGSAVVTNGSGNVLLQTNTTTADIIIDGDVRSQSGHISVAAADDILQNADLVTAGTGTLSLVASNANNDGVGSDGIVMQAATGTISGGGNIRLQAAGESDLMLGTIDAGTGDVSLVADRNVLSNNGAEDNVRGDVLRIVADANNDAAGTIGTADPGNAANANDHAIRTTVATLAAVSAGGIYVLESDALSIDQTPEIAVQHVGVDASTTTTTDTQLSDLETTINGSIKVVTLAGTLTIRQGDADDSGIRAASGGDILLEARGDASDLAIDADVATGDGNLSLLAADDIAIAADISAGGTGTIWMQAGGSTAESPAIDGIQMAAGSSITSGGDISIEALGDGDLVLQTIDAGTNAVRLAAAGNIVDGNGAATNVTAGSLILIADLDGNNTGSIGSPDPTSLPNDNLKAIDIDVDTVAARSGDGTYLRREAGNLVIDAVTVDVNRVNFNSTTTQISQTLSDLETTDSGSIKVVASDGDLTVNDGDSDGTAVSAAAGGDVLLDARGSGNLAINGSVFSGNGQIGLQAQESIALADAVVVQTGGDGTIVIDASLSAGTTGEFAMGADARVQTADGDIRILADQNVSVGRIQTLANVSLTSNFASILDVDPDDATTDVTAAGLRMNAFDGVGVLGAAANGLETEVATLSARAGSGGIHVVEADGLRVDDVAVQVQRPEFRSTLTTVNDLAQSDLRTTDGGSIVLRSLAGEITLNEGTASTGDGAIAADGDGNVLISAEGSGSRIVADADVTSGVGNISLLASDSIAINTDVNVTTTGDGTIDLEASTGALTMAADSTLQTTAGDIRAASGADLTIGDIVATDADVSLISTGGSILDADPDDADVDVTAIRLRLAAAIGAGTATNAIETDVDTLSGRATSGGIQLIETDSVAIDDVEVTVQRIATDATSTDLTDALQSDLRTTGGSGSIALQTLDGSITLNEGTAASGDGAISADGSGNVQINASGVDSDLIAGADIASGSGAIVIDAARDILLNADVDVTTAGAGTIDLTATTGNLTMAPTATLQSVAGDITGTAEQDVTIGDITSTMANVILTSHTSQIIDADPAGDSDQDIAAVEAILTAPLGIGDGNAIETSVSILDAEAATSGTIEIAESDAIELRQVITADGRIVVFASGTITATDVQSTNTSSSDAALGQASSRDIALVANGAASSILVTKITAAAGADVHLTAGNDILDTDIGDGNLIFADDLHLIAGNQTDDGDNAVQLTTTINDLQAEVSGSGRGDLEVNETDALNLVTSDEATDADVLRTSNGEIRVSAGGSIVISDPDLSNDGGDRTADPEIVAGGDNGRILLQTDGDLTIDEGVQIHASQSTAGAVRISAVGEILLGDQIEINTGASTGVARVFAPRPEAGVTDTAFYDYDTVSTTILASEPGGFGGDLTIDVGTDGERGLAIEIDWGAEGNRFQVVDGIDGDSLKTVHHTYTEAEILTSTLNGRPSSTSPLEVRFAVRQHESIVLEGASIEQGISGNQPVAGGLISSTDNPDTTPLLENGEGQFIVPNLSIPTRLFFPSPEYPELVRRVSESYTQPSTLLTTTTNSTETVTVTTTTARDEYFQIRVISPDPNVESEVPPERLPDDILSGDKLQTLFANLPDGTYEIEYVLGEGNARSILRVEIRQGKPIIPGEDLEGGLLRLKELDLDAIEAAPQPGPAAPNDLESTQTLPTTDAAKTSVAFANEPEIHDTSIQLDNQLPSAEWPAMSFEQNNDEQNVGEESSDEGLTIAAGSALSTWMVKNRRRPAGGEYSLTRRIVRRFAK